MNPQLLPNAQDRVAVKVVHIDDIVDLDAVCNRDAPKCLPLLNLMDQRPVRLKCGGDHRVDSLRGYCGTGNRT